MHIDEFRARGRAERANRTGPAADVELTVTLGRGEHKAMVRLAEERGLTPAAWVRRLIRAALAGEGLREDRG